MTVSVTTPNAPICVAKNAISQSAINDAGESSNAIIHASVYVERNVQRYADYVTEKKLKTFSLEMKMKKMLGKSITRMGLN